MEPSPAPPTWKDVLDTDAWRSLFSPGFLDRWQDAPWAPVQDDREAAARLHTEIASRIASQRLGYLDGVEKTALESVYALFPRTREICDRHLGSTHFHAVAWDVLNTRVRPFTARWHRASESGALAALDATDDFRAELAALQDELARFDDLLLRIRDGKAPPPRPAEDSASGISDEMDRPLRWGLHVQTGGIDAPTADAIDAAEREAVRLRRAHYDLPAGETDAAGLALSGGGIRSATFSLGVLVALAERGLLPQFDYLSTVSGGGYLGSFLGAFLNAPDAPSAKDGGPGAIGLRPHELPFQREGGEASALRHLRHHSKYLATGSWWERGMMLFAQLYGMVLNASVVVLLAIAAAAGERLLRAWLPAVHLSRAVPVLLAVAGIVGLAALWTLRTPRGNAWKSADRMIAALAVFLALLLALRGLDAVHAALEKVPWTTLSALVAVGGGVLLAASMLAQGPGRRLGPVRVFFVALSAVAASAFLFGIYLAAYAWAGGAGVAVPGLGTMPRAGIQLAVAAVAALVYELLLDVNVTSPHRHYRDRLARAYLIQPVHPPAPARVPSAAAPTGYEPAGPVPLSSLGSRHRAPYPLINCALNVPRSRNAHMQGRLTDFFLFSPAYCGSPVLGYRPTSEWEAMDPHLDLGTAMAISGAAAAPQMGLGTLAGLRFWMALLNVRLGYWVRRPGGKAGRTPGLRFLLREMRGSMDETGPWVHVSDGGHIENLGVYELLRRRCKYIVAVDGEQDAQMTFQGLTRLQRLAAIDLGVHIDVDLSDLRLNAQGLSRSHFRFCRVRYPSRERGSPAEFGYLLYVKLSLTGNEGEFIRRYRHDQPVFPHHSTADQFFSEEQFEAYRSLGEHAGNNLFLRAILRDLPPSGPLTVPQWFQALGESLLEPLRSSDPATSAPAPQGAGVPTE